MFNQDEQQMTDRMLRAIACPHVDILGHPTGRRLLKREPVKFDVGRVMDAAARAGVALEINSNVERLDLSDIFARLARDRGVPLVINTDSHNRNEFQRLDWGITVARRAWLTAADVLNTRAVDEFRAQLRRNRRS
jgi:DNA polymerase (family 10)